MKSERFREAVAAFSKAKTLAPDEPAVHFFRAQAYLELGDAGKALEDAREFSRMMPKDAPKEMREAAGNLERQVKERAEYLRRFGTQVPSLRREAANAYRADQYTLAESKLREAINICPPAGKHELECELSIVLANWAVHDVNAAGPLMASFALGTAEGRLQEAARLDPTNQHATSNLATVKMMKISAGSLGRTFR
jgi:Flp pilus assembly protein TadD